MITQLAKSRQRRSLALRTASDNRPPAYPHPTEMRLVMGPQESTRNLTEPNNLSPNLQASTEPVTLEPILPT